jgi:hypothetical protein
LDLKIFNNLSEVGSQSRQLLLDASFFKELNEETSLRNIAKTTIYNLDCFEQMKTSENEIE